MRSATAHPASGRFCRETYPDLILDPLLLTGPSQTSPVLVGILLCLRPVVRVGPVSPNPDQPIAYSFHGTEAIGAFA